MWKELLCQTSVSTTTADNNVAASLQSIRIESGERERREGEGEGEGGVLQTGLHGRRLQAELQPNVAAYAHRREDANERIKRMA